MTKRGTAPIRCDLDGATRANASHVTDFLNDLVLTIFASHSFSPAEIRSFLANGKRHPAQYEQWVAFLSNLKSWQLPQSRTRLSDSSAASMRDWRKCSANSIDTHGTNFVEVAPISFFGGLWPKCFVMVSPHPYSLQFALAFS